MNIKMLAPLVERSEKGLQVVSKDLQGIKIKIDESLRGNTSNVEKKLASFFETTTTNPLAMDAKSTLAKLKITTRVPSKKIDVEYQMFEEQVLKEAILAKKAKAKEILEKINPINSNNIDSIKTELTPFLEDTELKQKISDCSNPEELFRRVKSNMGNIMTSNKYTAFMQKVKASKITPELEREYSQVCYYEIQRTNRLMNMLTPKSTNPEVIRLEEEVRNLGVKDINCSDDL